MKPGHALFAIAVALSALVWSAPASAYAWMIRHEYAACSTCHADPSGGGLLTPYGRAQGVLLLASRYKQGADDSDTAVGQFGFGLTPLPDAVLLGADYRGAYLVNRVVSPGAPATTSGQYLQMQADLEGQVSVDRFRVHATVGYDHTGAQAAALTTRDEDNLVSRVHWAGADLGADRNVLVRAGRMNVPYGLRTIEHTMFIHSPDAFGGSGTRDDINTGQQYGAAVAYNGTAVRTEIMIVAGNYLIHPDANRERGYSGYFEWAPLGSLAVGVSSLVTYAAEDAYDPGRRGLVRQAHGAFARWAPKPWIAVMAEADALVDSFSANQASLGGTHAGAATMLQADFEPWQGLHLIVTGETLNPASFKAGTSLGGWLSVAWFVVPHVDIRTDAIFERLDEGGGAPVISAQSVLFQLHAYL